MWSNYSEQMTEKGKSVKTCTRCLKQETPPIYGNRCSFDQKSKGSPQKAGMNWLKTALCYSEKPFFENHPQQQQLLSSSYQRTQPQVNFLTKSSLRSEFSAQLLSRLNDLSLCTKRCTTKLKHKSLLLILQNLQFILFCVPKMMLHQIVVRVSKSLFLLMTLCTSLMRRTS